MPIAFDSATGQEFAAATSYTVTNVTASGTNKFALVMIGLRTNAGDITEAKFNNVVMTELTQWNNSDATHTIWVFGLANPTTGDVVITGDTSLAAEVIVSIYTGVAQTGSTGTVATNKTAVGVTDTTLTVDVTSATNELVVDCGVWNSGGQATPGAGQTERKESPATGDGISLNMTSSDEAGAATVTMSQTIGANSRWAIVGVPLKPVVVVVRDIIKSPGLVQR